MKTKKALSLSIKDNVAVALEQIESGDEIRVKIKGNGERFLWAKNRIPSWFKVALVDVPKGDQIIKYGELMGCASSFISAGDLVHIHNVEGIRVQKIESEENK
ncbi:MAG: UxaA family hydrolase [Candidatus Thorarchaeota archaeon]